MRGAALSVYKYSQSCGGHARFRETRVRLSGRIEAHRSLCVCVCMCDTGPRGYNVIINERLLPFSVSSVVVVVVDASERTSHIITSYIR